MPRMELFNGQSVYESNVLNSSWDSFSQTFNTFDDEFYSQIGDNIVDERPFIEVFRNGASDLFNNLGEACIDGVNKTVDAMHGAADAVKEGAVAAGGAVVTYGTEAVEAGVNFFIDVGCYYIPLVVVSLGGFVLNCLGYTPYVPPDEGAKLLVEMGLNSVGASLGDIAAL